MISSVTLTDGLKLEIYIKFDTNKFQTILYPGVLFIFPYCELEHTKNERGNNFWGSYVDTNV